MNFPARNLHPVCLLVALSLLWGATCALADDDQVALRRMRAERRVAAQQRNLSADKADAPGQFGLLVIPVDFSDARLPAGWDSRLLSQRLSAGSGETLHRYFELASGGRLDLKITMAPLISLNETRRLYSDRDLNGYTRTRKLASEAITAVRDIGLEFRTMDTDGPDGVAGTGDDDGMVDGVLILHSGIGNENDPHDGLIQALQFFLDEPVVSGGVSASFYAVASLQSGPGIWAHETAHLLGLEDRYDPILPVGTTSEVHSVGGLGRFSLMSSGAWGTGDGYGAAMPDAYSAIQMGWRELRNLTGTGAGLETLRYGEAARLWTSSEIGSEFFLLETRDPVASAPFDAAVPGGQMLIYHIDENISEGNWHEDGPYQWHLRVRLVEADADPDASLALGHNDGRTADLFPGSLGVTDFGPVTMPSSASYESGPSGVAVSGIAAGAGGMEFGVIVNPEITIAFDYGFALAGGDHHLTLTAHETGAEIGAMRCEVRAISSPAHGNFQAGASPVADFALVENQPGRWEPAETVLWTLFPDPVDDAQTEFRIRFYNATTTYEADERWWAWDSTGQTLDFRGIWPGTWTIDYPELVAAPEGNTNTTWHRWETAPWLTTDQTSVLICTGADFSTPALWPEVHYENQAYTTLTSAPVGENVTGVRLTHAIEVERLTEGTAMDGGMVVWVGPDDVQIPAIADNDYNGLIDSRSVNPLHGQAAFVGEDLELAGDVPIWRTDTFATPAAGQGPWRLRLVFAANRLWRARGWVIGNIEALTGGEMAPGFAPSWDGDLHWSWPWADGGVDGLYFSIESRPDNDSPWVQILDGNFNEAAPQYYSVTGPEVLNALSLQTDHRHQIRILGEIATGPVASRSVVVYPDGSDGSVVLFGEPWPNPFSETVRFLLDVPAGRTGTVKIFDLRGRLVATKLYGPGQQLALWDGLTENGVRLPAGVYYLRLEGTGSVLTRKVVLIH